MSEVGKSTVVKQMQLIHGTFDDDFKRVGEAFAEETRATYTPIVHQNVFEILTKLADENQRQFHFPYDNRNNENAAVHLISLAQTHSYSTKRPDVADHLLQLKNLWSDFAIRRVFEHRDKFELHSCAQYFMEELDRILEPNYIPSVDDILRSRRPTVGAIDYNFVVNRVKFTLKDIGGQITERRRYATYLDQCSRWVKDEMGSRVLSIMFVASLSDYDVKPEITDNNEKTPYDPSTKLQESISLFQVIHKLQELKDCGFTLFLNKEDVFLDKFRRLRNFHQYFHDFPVKNYELKDGGVEKAKDLIMSRFTQNINELIAPIFIKITKATDTGVMNAILAATHEVLISRVINSPIP